MTLSLFDADPSEGAGARRVTLVRLAGEIARAAGAVGRIAVEGEIHRPRTMPSGYIYLTLRDRAAQIDVRVPRSAARRCPVVAGERASVVGVLDWTPDRGQLSLVAEEITPVGAGAVAAALAEVRRGLAADGLLERPRRPLPVLPVRIGVVCGAEAAVRKDIESVVAARFPGYPVWFTETTVSGPGAVTSICEGLRRVTAVAGVEVVIVARGGGDATSLLPWSSDEVCRAVAAAPVPVVSAIGHDGDRPLCDEVADERAGTPSIAAAMVVPDRAGLLAELDRRLIRAADATRERGRAGSRRLAAVDTGRAVRAGLERSGGRLDRSGERLADLHPARALDAGRRRLAGVSWRRPAGEVLGRAAGRLESEGRHLRALSPHRVLERGYAVVSTAEGAVVRRADTLSPGDLLQVRLAEGSLTARVGEVRS